MVSFAALRAVAQRRIVSSSIAPFRQTQKRGLALGGSHGPPPEWEGVDKVVRGYFPEDYQLAIAILSAYGGMVMLYKIKSAISSKPEPVKEAAPAPAKTVSVASGTLPPVDSPAFDKFIETDAFYKMLEDEEQLKGLTESA